LQYTKRVDLYCGRSHESVEAICYNILTALNINVVEM